MSLFELPVSKGARVARVVAVVLLNLVLAGSGIAMIASYLGERAAAADAGTTGAAEPEPPNPGLEVLEPDPVDVDEVKTAPARPATKVAKPRPKAKVAGEPKAPARPKPKPVAPPKPKPRPPVPNTPPDDEDDVPAEPDTDTDTDTDEPDGGDDGVIADDPDEGARVEFSAAMVRRVVDRHTVQLQRCYKAAAKSRAVSDPLAGRVDVQFVITPEGTASNVTPVANTTGSPELATCVSKLIESWQFPSPGAEDIAFVWPFVFKAP